MTSAAKGRRQHGFKSCPAGREKTMLSKPRIDKAEGSMTSTAKGHAKHRRSWCRVGCGELMLSKPRVRQRQPAAEEQKELEVV